AVYADALYLCAVLAAFVLLERGHPVLAGLVGALATATRPVGYALILGLVLRSFERRGRPLMGTGPLAASGGGPAQRWAPAAVLLSVGGLASYSGWLWYRFGNPLAFISAQGEWGQPPGLATWSKRAAFQALSSFSFDLFHVRILVHLVLTLAAIALVPLVVRRLGWAYGAYAAATIAVPTLTSADFVGLGRYMLAAFPCFAVAGLLLSERPRLRAVVLPVSLGALVVFTSLFSRWNYVS
ncbi:MAG: mannosyltransferase family protein, partial [Acidimicrobiales bacterium]